MDNICEKLSPPEFILCISHPHLSLLCGNFLFLSNVFFFSLLLYFLVEYLFEYSDYFYIYCYILYFLYNIICFLEYKKVNRFVDFFGRKMRIYHFTQNICFFFCYVNQVFHTHKMWIMWITLCITLIYGIFQ